MVNLLEQLAGESGENDGKDAWGDVIGNELQHEHHERRHHTVPT
jgi:hypothetical protein